MSAPSSPSGARPLAHFDRSTLRARLRAALIDFEPGLEVVAEGLPALDRPIDLLATDAAGRIVAVLLASGDAADDDALLFTRGLAVRAWLEDQQPGWLQLVPTLEATSTASVRCLLLAPRFRTVTRAAAESLEPGLLDLVLYRPFEHGGDTWLLLEHQTARDRRPPRATPAESHPAAVAASPLPGLRTGLGVSDFGPTTGNSGGLELVSPARARFDAPGAPEISKN